MVTEKKDDRVVCNKCDSLIGHIEDDGTFQPEDGVDGYLRFKVIDTHQYTSTKYDGDYCPECCPEIIEFFRTVKLHRGKIVK